MNTTDRRFKRTHRMLQDALISLILEQGYEAVSIRDVTQRADVGYATFFRHFPDKEALLEEVLRSMKEEFEKLLTPDWLVTEPEQGCSMLFQFVARNYALVKVLLNTTSSMTLLKPVQEIALQDLMRNYAFDAKSSIPVDVTAGFLLSSLIMIVRWWVEHEQPYSAEEMGRFTAELVLRPILGKR